MTRADRVRGGLLGLLVGDALGVPYEFHRAEDLPTGEALDMVPPPAFPRTWPSVPPGTWSDDGAQALALLDALLACGRLDLDDLGRRLLAWYREGAWAVGGLRFDVGLQTARALEALADGASPERSGPRDVRSNGNGSLMRVLPLALWHRGDDAALADDAHRQSLVTHGHPHAQVCCALYCLWARAELDGGGFDDGLARLRRVYVDRPDHWDALAEVAPLLDDDPRGSGWVIDALRSARFACGQADYPAIVRAAIALGDDTDTTAAIAGGIAGVRHGAAGIPERWRGLLRERERAEALLDRLVG